MSFHELGAFLRSRVLTRRYILADGPLRMMVGATKIWRCGGEERRTALTAANVSGYVETWKRVWKSAWRLERGWGEGECGLRGPHGVVKSIRPGLEPRLLALLTAVRRERHQRDWEDLEDIEATGGAWGPRIKYHPRYVPFENATSFSILSPFFAPSHLEGLSLWISHLFTFCYLLNASLPVSARLSFVFSNSTAPTRYIRIRRNLPSSFQRILDGMHRHVGDVESSRATWNLNDISLHVRGRRL